LCPDASTFSTIAGSTSRTLLLPIRAMSVSRPGSERGSSRKPDREIFELAARRALVEPGSCVLIDDVEKNCAAAEAAGWHAIRFAEARPATEELWELAGVRS
jgi:beta-phosphoglucomutase-like phosphatase (HAD superfamily)